MTCKEVDPCFIPFCLKHGVDTLLINGRNIGRLESFLEGKPVVGTRIGTTF
jgi:hypothetical protein